MDCIDKEVMNKVKNKINIVFDTSIYHRFLCTICDELDINCHKCRDDEVFGQKHIEFLKVVMDIMIKSNGCIYVYVENKSKEKGLYVEYEDLQKIVDELYNSMGKSHSYTGYISDLLDYFLYPYDFNIIKNYEIKDPESDSKFTIRTLSENFIFMFVSYILEFIIFNANYMCQNYDCICYIFFKSSNRNYGSFKEYINSLNESKINCQIYDKLFYKILECIYDITLNEEIINSNKRFKSYRDHLSNLLNNYFNERVREDLHILMTPLTFYSKLMDIFYINCYYDLSCRCNSEFLNDNGNNYGVISAITLGKCSNGDSILFIDESNGKKLIGELVKNMKNKNCNELIIFTYGGFIPVKIDKSNICFSTIYLCES